MTFLEAALEILKRERKPLHYKELTERAMDKKLLTFVGRTPEVTMQTQLTNAVKKAPGNPFVRVKPGVFGLLRYPEVALDAEADRAPAPGHVQVDDEQKKERTATRGSNGGGGKEGGEREGPGRRRRRGGRGKGRRPEAGQAMAAAEGAEAAPSGGSMTSDEREPQDEERDLSEAHEGPDEPEIGS